MLCDLCIDWAKAVLAWVWTMGHLGGVRREHRVGETSGQQSNPQQWSAEQSSGLQMAPRTLNSHLSRPPLTICWLP